ncbi:hypothetical protein FB451DRAFT_307877 [Mycena latifolia]|nr:hypothetical protein FB451DRAFT_307877 [Mycena latifolia]
MVSHRHNNFPRPTSSPSRKSSGNTRTGSATVTRPSPRSPPASRHSALLAKSRPARPTSSRTSSSSMPTTRYGERAGKGVTVRPGMAPVAPAGAREAPPTVMTMMAAQAATKVPHVASARLPTACPMQGTMMTAPPGQSGPRPTQPVLSGVPALGSSSTPSPSPRHTRTSCSKSKFTHETPKALSATFSTHSMLRPFQNPNGRMSFSTASWTSTPSSLVPTPSNRKNRSSLSSVTPTWKSRNLKWSRRSPPTGSGSTPTEPSKMQLTLPSTAATERYAPTGTTSTISSVVGTLPCMYASSTTTARPESLMHTFLTEESPSPLPPPRTVRRVNLPVEGRLARPAPRRSVGTITRAGAASAANATTATHASNAMEVDTPPPSAQTERVAKPELPARSATSFELAARPHIGWFTEVDDSDDAHGMTSFLPKYMRGMAWKDDQPSSYSRTARYTELDEPLPRPPTYEFQNTAVMCTIRENPDLFHNPRVIEVERFESLLNRHPNPPFVQSVMAGLREGFWPWMDTHHDTGYPETWDNSWAPPASDRERDFINSQRDVEIAKGRFSRTFGPDLLPGMYSTPILAVPKPHSDDLRLVSHQSCGPFAPNTMVDKTKTKGPRMDTMQQFIPALLRFRREHPDAELVVWKSDVAEAFRLTSVHKLAQIKQIATSNLPTRAEVSSGKSSNALQRNVDWCSTFGNCGSPRIWASVMGLVIWIATFVKLLPDIFCYVDDTYGWEFKTNLTYYPPFKKHFPTKQAKLLFLWDFLGIPHKEKKQLFGSSLPIIGFEIDPNAMTAKLPPDSKADLERWVQEFIDTPSRRRTLHEFQCLTGWINWSLNMYFLLRPALSNIYNKMSGKSQPHASIYINTAIKSDLGWFLGHLRKSNGVLFFQSLDWNPLIDADLTVYCDASLRKGMGFWIPELLLGFYSPVPGDPPADTIFFFEALCVISALRWVCTRPRAAGLNGRHLRATIFTDNQNTVNIFNSLCATPNYNPLLRTAIDDLIQFNVDLRVLHVKGEDNSVADAISRQRFSNATERAPGLSIQPFTPPREPLGASES